MHPVAAHQQGQSSPGAAMRDNLWHYTCAHAIDALDHSATLLPPLWQIESVPGGLPPEAYTLLGLVWATDMDPPNRSALGLTMATLSCDRMTHRYAVPRAQFTHWGRVRSRLPSALVNPLELAQGAQPAHWWVADRPVEGAYRDKEWPGA
jgi:hypothetical protein